MLVGAPGGSRIICSVAKNLVLMLDFGLNPLQASSSGNLCAINTSPLVEKDSAMVSLIPALEDHGQKVLQDTMWSGEVNIARTKNGWAGATDPRVDGLALGN